MKQIQKRICHFLFFSIAWVGVEGKGAIGGMDARVCGRSYEVSRGLERKFRKSCAEITAMDLASMNEVRLDLGGLRALKLGDLEGFGV